MAYLWPLYGLSVAHSLDPLFDLLWLTLKLQEKRLKYGRKDIEYASMKHASVAEAALVGAPQVSAAPLCAHSIASSIACCGLSIASL